MFPRSNPDCRLPWCWMVDENLLDVLEECACWDSWVVCRDSLEPGSECTWGWTRPVTGGLFWWWVLRELLLWLPGWRSAKAPSGVYFPDDLEDVEPSEFALGVSATP